MNKLEIWMPPEEKEYLVEHLADAGTIVEYGAGGSTVEALRHPSNSVFSVESSEAWLDKVKQQVEDERLPGSFYPIYCDIGPIKDRGYPLAEDETTRPLFPKYAKTVWQVLLQRDLTADFVLIDGRFRVACFVETLQHCTPQTTVLFDDYLNRKAYHIVEEIVRPTEMVGRMAIFSGVEKEKLDVDWASYDRFYVNSF